MHAMLLWTIGDFPSYANLSGWSIKGELVWPICHKHTNLQWLKNGKKHCYIGHHWFLDPYHPFRKNARSFDGKQEHEKPPIDLMGDIISNELANVQFQFGRLMNDNNKLPYSWKKRNMFFELPYWKDNLLRHNLDAMHIEKNVCECICTTLLELDKKKDF